MTDPGYFQLWEEGRGPKLSGPDNANQPPGLGDMVERALTAIGITKERVEASVGAPCGCEERREKLNRLGAWAASFFRSRQTEVAKRELEEIIAGSRD